MNRSLLLLLPLPLIALYASPAQAAEYGAIRGHVEDDGGLPVPGATVSLSGPNIAGELTTTTDENGDFRFINIPPGTHTAKVVKSGLSQATLHVTVRLDETAFMPVTLSVTAGMEVVIEEQLPVIDTTRSAISTEMSAESLHDLPVGRSYQDAVQMVPGVSGRVDTSLGGPSDGNPSVRGEGQYGNNYLLDGISTRDPSTKTFGQDIQYDAISDIQVYTDGAPAEFGEATGMVVNVVTKDGGDEHHGSIGYYLTTSASGGTYDIRDSQDINGNGIVAEEVPTKKRTIFDNQWAFTVGGPLIKEKLWYFASGTFLTNKDKYEGSDVYSTEKGVDGFGKLTWFVTPEITLRAQMSGSFRDEPNYQTSSQFDATAQQHYFSDDYSPLLKLDWRFGEKSILEAEGLYQNGYVNVTPQSGDLGAPEIFNLDTGTYTGNTDASDLNQRGRAGGLLRFTQLADHALGKHKIKIGTEYWVVTDSRELIYTGTDDAANLELGKDTPDDTSDDATGVKYTSSASQGYPCVQPDHSDCYYKQEERGAGALGHVGDIFTVFAQDDWQPVKPVTLNIGVRLDHEQLYQNEGLPVVSSWMLQPRVGGAWDITNDSKTLLSAVAGRYYDVAGNAFADWGDTRSSYVYAQYVNDGDPSDGSIWTNVYTQDPTANPSTYCNDYSLDAYQQRLVDLGYADAEGAATQRQTVENDYCNGPLRPYHMDKVAVGFKREIFPLFALGIRGIWSTTRDLPEDVNFEYFNYVITNPAVKRRDYRALELTAEKKFDHHWQILASYTLSESLGTNPGQFELASGGSLGSAGNDVGVFLDDFHGTDFRQSLFDSQNGWLLNGFSGLGRTDDTAGWYGYLPYHSFHNVKINGSYTFNFGTTVGLVYEVDSGHAWQKRGLVDLYQDYYAFPEGRGTRFMPAVNYVDVRLAHRIKSKKDENMSAEIAVNINNVFDFETPVTYYENDDESFGLTLYRQAPRSIEGSLKVTY